MKLLRLNVWLAAAVKTLAVSGIGIRTRFTYRLIIPRLKSQTSFESVWMAFESLGFAAGVVSGTWAGIEAFTVNNKDRKAGNDRIYTSASD